MSYKWTFKYQTYTKVQVT